MATPAAAVARPPPLQIGDPAFVKLADDILQDYFKRHPSARPTRHPHV